MFSEPSIHLDQFLVDSKIPICFVYLFAVCLLVGWFACLNSFSPCGQEKMNWWALVV